MIMAGCSDYDFEVLKKTVWFESLGEPLEGKFAIAHLIMNRARANRDCFGGNTIAGVCLAPMQFATWNNQKPECLHPHGKEWDWMDRCLPRTHAVCNVEQPETGVSPSARKRMGLDGSFAAERSLHFCNPTEKMPDWTRTMQKGVKIGKYQYYNEEKAPSIFNSEEKFVKQNYDYFLEIIEFPVAKLNASTLKVESVFHKYVRPTVNRQLSTFCTHLTGITQETVDQAEPLSAVLKSFDEWFESEGLHNSSFAFVTCGDWGEERENSICLIGAGHDEVQIVNKTGQQFDDLNTQLPNEADFKNFVLPTYFSSWLNIKKSVTALTGVTRKGMKGLLEIMQIELKGRHHSGIDDVKNIVEITKWLLKKGHVIKNEDASTNRIGAT
uniref:Exonuclease domain-containing protein n=1 Tax=Pristionchus pacificus TaxID=54126 RepID=A0A2A6CV26_PRIPA|eukprot:PDM81881.1 hypothetical protein PRIPAC_34035 [Pristionchus pacificus]